MAREVGVSIYTIYSWKVKFGGLISMRPRSCGTSKTRTAAWKKLVAEPALEQGDAQGLTNKKTA
jgi:hypothetical protein